MKMKGCARVDCYLRRNLKFGSFWLLFAAKIEIWRVLTAIRDENAQLGVLVIICN